MEKTVENNVVMMENQTNETTIVTEKKENWLKRTIRKPKVRKGLKVAGRVAEGALLFGLGLIAGHKIGGRSSEPIEAEGTVDDPELEELEQMESDL